MHRPALAALAGLAGLDTLPKATALGSYSYKVDRARNVALLEVLALAMLATCHSGGRDFDFHAIMHCGDDVALETHYVPRRSQRTESVLTLFAADGSLGGYGGGLDRKSWLLQLEGAGSRARSSSATTAPSTSCTSPITA